MATAPREPRKDGAATRIRILQAAGELFAALGYAEASNKAVAAKAEVDLASINYHFGSRNGLYLAVLDEARRRFLDISDLQRIALGDQPATEKLRALVELVVYKASQVRDNWHLRVLAAELLAPSPHGQAHLQAGAPLKLALLKNLFSEITAIAPEQPALTRCILCVTAPWAMLLIGPRGSSGALHEILGMPAEEVAGHLYRFALAGLQETGRHFAQGNGQ
ncbi:TetR/AcrR family transcriptional regulator [Pseudomonas putida]|uniref:TetR/AcrR family transcriptional regulator n=1 Tax=Pseudomonas putida TaxID=303 RepID=A0A7W2QI20_PSEPU|nr:MULTISPECIES: TetR/AcrR family transcriptional regulator [Pseudomonas]MBA6115332.1 TetR/AcrR family transcriptional regulator [Pseudomonas putida]MBI6939947.1 TetR/AcrR family transcriptional regulator [Pseudomonas putida]MBI6956083.1 TetR/AcrR family transcriptional regulator [Pseudomonas putida]MCZ9639514.1 TetR/AcrR family transcriptional regulator [Pseudomonas putida]MEC4878083.1 TetR/AcrR family transcriptional regulator [Pseudomonas sp. NC26]